MFKKGVTVGLIAHYLERAGLQQHQVIPEPGEKEGLVLTGWALPSGRSHVLSIDPIVERHVLIFRAREVARAPTASTPADRLHALLLVISAVNHDLVLGRWVLDPRSGELEFKIALPIAGGSLDFADFELCLQTLVTAVETDGAMLEALVDGTASPEEVLAKAGISAAPDEAERDPAEGGYL